MLVCEVIGYKHFCTMKVRSLFGMVKFIFFGRYSIEKTGALAAPVLDCFKQASYQFYLSAIVF